MTKEKKKKKDKLGFKVGFVSQFVEKCSSEKIASDKFMPDGSDDHLTKHPDLPVILNNKIIYQSIESE